MRRRGSKAGGPGQGVAEQRHGNAQQHPGEHLQRGMAKQFHQRMGLQAVLRAQRLEHLVENLRLLAGRAFNGAVGVIQ